MARRRKHKHEEHENHERWLVSYADFITLLFAFFVVMYSISSVNEGKYRVLSDSLVAAFRSSARSMQPIQIGNVARSPRNTSEAIMELPLPVKFTPIVINAEQIRRPVQVLENLTPNGMALEEGKRQITEIAEEVESAIQDLVASEMVSLRRNQLWLEIELRTSFLFPSGSAIPSIDAELILHQIGKALRTFPNKVLVEGYTDSNPITSMVFPSNWELSAARASAVVRLFQRSGVQPERLAAIGYGAHHPIASNDTEAGRLQNRRVVIVVVAHMAKQPSEQDSVLSFDMLKQKIFSAPGQIY